MIHKFFGNRENADNQPLFWGRAAEDGMPFRGKQQLYASDDEYDDQVQTVSDFKFKLFDLKNPQEAAEYINVRDRITNGWYSELFIERIITDTTQKIFLEWVEYFKQDVRNPQQLTPVGAPQQHFAISKDAPNGMPQNSFPF